MLELHPFVRPIAGPFVQIETVRPALSSGDALPMGAFAVCSLVKIDPVGEVSLLGGELALPAFGWPASAA